MTAAKCEANDVAETFQEAAKRGEGRREKGGKERAVSVASNSLLHATGDWSLREHLLQLLLAMQYAFCWDYGSHSCCCCCLSATTAPSSAPGPHAAASEFACTTFLCICHRISRAQRQKNY